MAIFPGERVFSHDSLSPYIFFNSIPPCPSQTEEGGKGVDGNTIHCGTTGAKLFVAGCHSCRQPVLKTQQEFVFSSTVNRFLREGKGRHSLYVCCQTSIPHRPTHYPVF